MFLTKKILDMYSKFYIIFLYKFNRSFVNIIAFMMSWSYFYDYNLMLNMQTSQLVLTSKKL